MLSVPHAVLGIATRPVALVNGLDHLVTQLGQVATRALALLDVAEPVAARVSGVVDEAESLSGRVTAVVADAEAVAARVEATVARAERVAADVEAIVTRAEEITGRAGAATDDATATVTRIQPLLDQVAPLLQAGSALDPEALLALVETLPVVLEKLAAQVDSLDRTVADVGALLQGIPGAARLAKRGATLAPR